MYSLREFRRDYARMYLAARCTLRLARLYPDAVTKREARDAADDVRIARGLMCDHAWLHYFTYPERQRGAAH